MNKVQFIVVGQGISGTWLSYYLNKEKKSFHVVDNNDPNASSRLAAGVINPVTGRRHVEVWMAKEVLPFAWQAYHEMGILLDIHAISTTSIIDFFPSPQMRLSFLERVAEKKDYVSEFHEPDYYHDYLKFEFGAGEIKPVYISHLESILPAWRNYLSAHNLIDDGVFDYNELHISPGQVRYRDIEAEKIIFCDGGPGARNPWFKNLPFAPNKGEIMTAEIPELNKDYIYKKGMVMVPLVQKDLWWIGSDYKWEYEDERPTIEFLEKTRSWLNNFLKVPFKIVDHTAGIRPATLERRPFVGMHPVQQNVGILNGMGTKGCSLAPYFAKQLCEHFCSGLPILPEADVVRFRRILGEEV